MTIFVIRHGESEGNRLGIIQGHLDYPLTDTGRKQALEAATLLSHFRVITPPPIIFSSDLVRAWETAMIISESLKLNSPISDDRLREGYLGDAQGKLWTTLDWKRFDRGIGRDRLRAESLVHHVGRIRSFLIHAISHGEKLTDTAIICSHGGTIRCLYHLLFGLGVHQLGKTDNASVHRFEVNLIGRKIVPQLLTDMTLLF